MDFLEIIIPEITLTHQVYRANVVVGQCEQLITIEYCICVIVHVEVLDSEIVKFAETLVGQHSDFKSFKFLKVMLRMSAVVRLQDLSEEEYPVGFGRVEDCGLS
jgi:hypothetical protein